MRRNYIALTHEAIEKYTGKTVGEIADMYTSADERKELVGVYIGRKYPKGEYPVIIRFATIEDLYRFEITRAGIRSGGGQQYGRR